MKKLLITLLSLFALTWVGCGGDDNDDNGGNNGDDPTVEEVIANITVGAPSLTNTEDAAWSTVTAKSLDIDYRNPPPTATSSLTDSIWVQAIVADGMLYLRLVWEDDSLDLDRYNWTLSNTSEFTWTRAAGTSGEDQLLAMFEGEAGFGWDVWHWRSLTTAQGNLAEGRTWDSVTLVSDSGAQSVVYENYITDFHRPGFVHTSKGDFNGRHLTTADTLRATTINLGSDPSWSLGNTVPGYILNNEEVTFLAAHPNSRWDIETVYEYNAATDRYTLVMACDLAGSNHLGTTDDLDMTALDRITMRLGILTDHTSLSILGTNIGFTEDFYLILNP